VDDVRVADVAVSGDVVLRYLTAGSGPPLVMLPGWSQTAELFRPQVETLSATHEVLALDHRGHGRSDTPAAGYHIHRLAADVHEVLTTLDLREVRLLGHSMGCAVIWSYLELFGDDRIAAVVLVDQMPCALRNPLWADADAEQAGATIDVDGLWAFTNGLRGDGEDPRIGFLSGTTSDGLDADVLDRLVAENLLFDRTLAAGLLFDTATHDWRAALGGIDVPTLVVAGDSPNVPIASQRAMAEAIPGARFEHVGGVSGGTHFPFVESPAAFGAAVADFLDSI